MKTITFIRHGESTANAGGVTIKHELIPLSDAGMAQAQSIADSINVLGSFHLSTKAPPVQKNQM